MTPDPCPHVTDRLARLRAGDTLVVSLRAGSADAPLIPVAQAEGRYVRIDRKTPWGNPYVLGKDGDRETVIRLYADHLLAHPSLLAELETLRGKALGCWCAPLPCHGDVLVAALERDRP